MNTSAAETTRTDRDISQLRERLRVLDIGAADPLAPGRCATAPQPRHPASGTSSPGTTPPGPAAQTTKRQPDGRQATRPGRRAGRGQRCGRTAPGRDPAPLGNREAHRLHVQALVSQARQGGWDTCLILTPTAARWLGKDLETLEKDTGHPVRSAYKLPGEPDVLPGPDAILVAPATSNTINKWALGISDTLALGLITEGIGKRLPIAALPYLNKAQAAHPAFPRSVSVLADAGVNILLGPRGYEPHGSGESRPDRFPWHLGLDALDGKVP